MKPMGKKLYVCYVVLFFIMFVSFFYTDILITAEHGANFWDLLFSGNIHRFYEKNVIEYTGDLFGEGNFKFGAAYNILPYIVFAVWCIPLKIWSVVTGTDTTSIEFMRNSSICLIWLKLLLMLAAAYVLTLLKDIMHINNNEEEERWLLTKEVFITSILGLSCLLIMSRYDIFCSIFMLLALRACLTDNYKEFILWSGVALCFNYFSLLFFVPLLLLRYKDIKMILKSFGGLVLPMIITKLPFIFHPPGKESSSLSKMLFQMLFSKDQGVFSIFLVGFILLLLFCYVVDIKDYKNKLQIYVWVCSAAFFLLFGFCYSYPYWPILLLPFISLLIGVSDRRFDVSNLIAETIAMFGLMFSNMLVYHWCYFKTVFACNTMWKHLLVINGMEYPKVMKVINHLNPNNMGYILLHSLFVAGLIFILYVNFPFKQKLNSIFNFDNNQFGYARGFRFMCTVVICLLPLFGLLR